jgi:hypothetical protein
MFATPTSHFSLTKFTLMYYIKTYSSILAHTKIPKRQYHNPNATSIHCCEYPAYHTRYNRGLNYVAVIYTNNTSRNYVMQLGSMFISNCNNTLHVSDAICVHPQEYLKTVVTVSGVWHETGWSIQSASKVDGFRTKSYCIEDLLHPVSCQTPETVTTVFKCSW